MDTLIFLGTLVTVLVGGYLVVKLIIHKRSSGRRMKYRSIPVDSRLKQRHTGRPHLRHQTSARVDYSDEIWRASRRKEKETSWESGSFTANKISTDTEKEEDMRKQHEGLAMPVIHYEPTDLAKRPASAGAAKRSNQRR